VSLSKSDQHLSLLFDAGIFNNSKHLCIPRNNTNFKDVLQYQTHLDKRDLLVGIVNYSPDDDSFEDFINQELPNFDFIVLHGN
jgi:hypothetical protein